jgi:hypothetical protein
MPTFDTAIEKNFEDMPTDGVKNNYRTGNKTCDPN